MTSERQNNKIFYKYFFYSKLIFKMYLLYHQMNSKLSRTYQGTFPIFTLCPEVSFSHFTITLNLYCLFLNFNHLGIETVLPQSLIQVIFWTYWGEH